MFSLPSLQTWLLLTSWEEPGQSLVAVCFIVNVTATDREAIGLISSIFLLDALHSFLLLEGNP